MNNKRLKRKLDRRGIEYVPFGDGFAINADRLSEKNRRWLLRRNSNSSGNKIKRLIKNILK